MNTNPAHKAKGIAKQYQIQLLEWYAIQGRTSLPWRTLKGENAPYGVYVSEIMLQQTQVKRVQEHYFTPFLNAFPTLESLAKASLDSILKQWEGLGYYTRARNMQKAAILCCENIMLLCLIHAKICLNCPELGHILQGRFYALVFIKV